MKFHRLKVIVGITLLSSLILSSPISAKPEACKGVSEKCTKDKVYDKTIGGTIYSCYNCKQALCKDSGNGGLAGSSTKSVCTEKATTFQPISQDGQFNGGSNKLAPKAKPPSRIGLKQKLGTSSKENRAIIKGLPKPKKRLPDVKRSFDEADALFGKRTSVNDKKNQSSSKTEVPDVEKTPTPGGFVPIPYPVINKRFNEADALFGKRSGVKNKLNK